MSCATQKDRLICRPIVFGKGGSQVLVASAEGRFVLPELELPKGRRIVHALTSLIKSQWNIEAVYLFPIRVCETENSDLRSYHAVELWQEGKLPDYIGWSSIRALAGCCDSRMDFASVQAAQEQGKNTEPFSHFGWFDELRSWVGEAIRPLGLTLQPSFQQFNGGPRFNLIRFETGGPAVWFKAVGEPNLREFAITQTLARLFSDHIPQVLGIHRPWNGWLSLEADGTNLFEANDAEKWHLAAVSLAKLQIQSIEHKQSLLDAGVRPLTLAILAKSATPFFTAISELMEEQRKTTPKALPRDELDWLRDVVLDALFTLSKFALPDALGHLDLNPGNIVIQQPKCCFLDWAEAYVGHPFFSFNYLVEHYRRAVIPDVGFEERMGEEYFALWKEHIPSEQLSDAARLSPLLSVFAYAVSLWNAGIIKRSTGAAYLRALARRMRREACQLRQQESPCLV